MRGTRTISVDSLSATHCLFPDIALNPNASPSCSGQIFINIVWGGPIANRIQWIGNNSSVGSLLNHPFVIEIRVLIFNPCCETLYCYNYAKKHVLRIKTDVTQIHLHYSIFHYKSEMDLLLPGHTSWRQPCFENGTSWSLLKRAPDLYYSPGPSPKVCVLSLEPQHCN